MVVEKRPGIAGRMGLIQQIAQPLNKHFPIRVVEENVAAINTPCDDVLQQTGVIYAGMSWHGESVTEEDGIYNNVP